MKAQHLCSVCRRGVPPRAENAAFPFCSARCRAVDLGKWLGEEYRLLDRAAEEEEDGPPDLDSEDVPRDR